MRTEIRTRTWSKNGSFFKDFSFSFLILHLVFGWIFDFLYLTSFFSSSFRSEKKRRRRRAKSSGARPMSERVRPRRRRVKLKRPGCCAKPRIDGPRLSAGPRRVLNV